MKTFNAIHIAPVRSLEVGDLIAKKFLGTVVSGRITGIASFGFQLTVDQRNYLSAHEIEIPEDENESLGGSGYCLLFGEFSGPRSTNHMFLDYDINVAVFPQG